MVENGLRPIYFRNWGQKCFRVLEGPVSMNQGFVQLNIWALTAQ